MSRQPIVQIVPRLPPAPDGVGHYAAALGEALRAEGISSRFVSTERPSGAGEDASVVLAEHSVTALLESLERLDAEVVLLHYVNYAYQPRGCPSWLVEGLRRWRRTVASRRLVTVFHEVFATGPPWRSSFWLFPWQRHLAASMLHASDAALTSVPLYGRRLEHWQAAVPVVVAPVFSTVGEARSAPRLDERNPRAMVVFGSPGVRQRAYGELLSELAASCQALGVDEIVDVGPPLATLPAHVGEIGVRALGALSSEDVAAVLNTATAGFVGYPMRFIAKSTVFAAYCAHGLVPVCFWPATSTQHRPTDGSPPTWVPGGDAFAIARQGWEWYQPHSLRRQAHTFASLLQGSQEPLQQVQAQSATASAVAHS